MSTRFTHLLRTFLPLVALALFFHVPTAEAARLSLTSAPPNLFPGCVISVDILLDTQGEEVNAVDAFLKYDPSQISIVDQNPNLAGTQISKGVIFPVYATNQDEVNETTGEIKVTAFDMFGAYNGSGVFATLVFQGKPGVSSTNVTFEFTPGGTLDSNVADLYANDILSSVQNQTYTFGTTPCNPDVEAPVVTTHSPSNGAQDQPFDSNVTFTITDNQSGIDLNSVIVNVYTSTYTQASPQLTYSGVPTDYDFIINPANDFPFNTGITVVIQAADISGNVMSPKTFSFNSPDTQAPTVANVNPHNGQKNVPLNSNVSFDVRDDSLGVDISTVTFMLDGVEYFPSSPGVTQSGDASQYSFVIDPANDFPELTEISLIVTAADLGGNVMSPKTFKFNRPPAPSVCGDNVVEGNEQCEPGGSLGCDANCQIVVEACILGDSLNFSSGASSGFLSPGTVTQGSQTSNVISNTTQQVAQGIRQVLFDTGITEAPVEVAGVQLQDVKGVSSFVCEDAADQREVVTIERTERPYVPPAGYEIIQEEMAFACDGEFQTTINLPQEYVDIQALKCIAGVCNNVEVTATQTIQCAGEVYSTSTETSSSVATVQIDALERGYDSNRYRAIALPESDDREYLFKEYEQDLAVPLHPSLQLLTAPVVLQRINGTPEDGDELIQMILPYVESPQVSSASIQVYALDLEKERWKLVPGSVLLEESLQVQVEIDLAELNGSATDTVFAVMGIRCENCDSSEMVKVYEPLNESRAVIVLVHDLSGKPSDWDAFIADVQKTRQPWQLWSFEYPVDENLKQSAQELAMSLQYYENDYDVVYLVGHGVGGSLAKEALAHAYRENALNPNRYPFLKKVKRAVLLGTPEASPRTEPLLLSYYNYLLNSGKGVLFGPDRLQELLGVRSQIPRIPGVEYYSVVGTKAFDDSFLQVAGASVLEGDGNYLASKSAQVLGGQSDGDQCKSYWEIDATQYELPAHPDVRRVVGQLISKDVSKAVKNAPLLGYQQYFRLADATCSAEDRYILIGRKLKREKTIDPLNCSCGNGYCGIDEDKSSCPQDCSAIVREENYPWILLTMLVLGVLVVSGVGYKVIRKKKRT